MKYLKLNIQLFSDGKVVIETDLNEKGFKKGLSKIQSVAKTGFKTVATSVGVVSSAMAGLLGYGVKYNAEIEQLTTSFEVMTGSAEKAAEITQKLKDVGAKTPYDLKGLAQTTQTLMQYGLSADEAYEATLNFGDIAQGSAEKMQGIALAYGQMHSAGKLNMQDIKQMINQGFNPLQAVADMTGETMEEVTARYEDNAISVEEVTKAMKYASKEGGKFYKSMEKQSKTLNGQISTLQDNFSSLAGTLSKELSQTMSGEVLPAINELLTNLETAFSEEGISGLASTLGSGLANIITALVEETPKFIEVSMLIIQNLITGIQNNLPTIVQGAMTIISTLLTSLMSMLPQILQLGIDLIIQLVEGMAEQAPVLIPQIVETMLQLFLLLTSPENLDRLIEAGIKLIMALIEGIINSIPKLLENSEATLQVLLNVLSGGQVLMRKIGWALLKALIKGLGEWLGNLGTKAKEVLNTIVSKIKEGLSKMKEVGVNLVKGLWEGLKSSTDWIKKKIENWVGDVLEFIKDLFGINSPAKTTMEDGKYLAQGLGVGFDKELDSVYGDMQHAIDLETSKMTANVQTSGTYQMAMAGTPTFNLLDRTSNTTQLVCNDKVLAEVVNTANRNREVATA